MKRYRWLAMRPKSMEEAPLEPPIWLGNHSNGEYFHQATRRERRIREAILQRADEGARRHGIDRRQFLASSMGMATSLATINMFAACSADEDKLLADPAGSGSSPPAGTAGNGAGAGGLSPGTLTGAGTGGSGNPDNGGGMSGGSGQASGGTTGVTPPTPAGGAGGFFDAGDPMDPACAAERMLDPEATFVLDLQTHYLERVGNDSYANFFFPAFPQSACRPGAGLTTCFGRDEFIDLMFMQSETTVAMLSAVPAVEAENPLTNDELAAGRDLINMLGGDTQRLIIQGQVLPNDGLQAQLDGMQRLVEELGIACWKVHTEWGPRNVAFNAPDGFWLDDYQASGAAAVGIPFIERARSLGVKSFCCHKGLPAPQFNSEHCSPRDIGPAARMFPDCNFVVYHSAYGFGGALGGGEGAYVEGSMSGIDSMITVMRDSGVGANENVFAELAGVWSAVMTNPTTAAHVIGKLLLHVGADNVLWGTDAIWQGKPQPYVDSFWAFQISQEFQDRYGYPALTDELKRKVLGLNSARIFGIDAEATRCALSTGEMARAKRVIDGEFGSRRWAPVQPIGPTTRREFARLQQLRSFLKVPG